MSVDLPKIFLSYARSDAEFALRLAKDLRAAGVNLWVDQLDIRKGSRWDEAVGTALKTSSSVLVILSADSVASENVMDEVAYALSEKKFVLPVLLKQCEIPFRLRRFQYIDFTGDYDSAVQESIKTLSIEAPPPTEPETEQAPSFTQIPPPPRPSDSVGAADRFTPASARPDPELRAPGARVARTAKWVAPIALVLLILAVYLFRETHKPVPSPAHHAAITPQEGRQFVDRYLEISNRGDAVALVGLYADQVRYYSKGIVDKNFILKDKTDYYRRWPEVQNRLASEVTVDPGSDEATATLSFTIAYVVRSQERASTKSGNAREELQVQKLEGGDLKIVGHQQQVLK